MSLTQSILHGMEEGKGRILIRLVPLAISVLFVFLVYNFSVYRGLNDPQSMDNAQLARQIARGAGFTTEFLRPAALAQLSSHAAAQAASTGNSGRLFPAQNFPPGVPLVVPDTYNAPGYPYLLAGWFHLVRPDFSQSLNAMAAKRIYAGDRVIPWLNQIFLLLTAALVFLLARRIFDLRVAWLSLVAFLATDIVWQYSITALSTSLLIFLVTAILYAATETFCAAETRAENGDAPAWPAWAWAVALGLLLGFACLTRLHLLILLVPVGVFLLFVRRSGRLFIPLVAVLVLVMAGPWFWHMNAVSGSPVGSNAMLLHYGMDEYTGDQIYRTFQAPANQQLFQEASRKEWWGFGYNFAHAWELLGTNPLVLLFGASFLHNFRRPRAQALRWLILGAAFGIVAATNLCMAVPEAVGPWNTLVVLLPGMIVVGSAFFFILLDRLDLSIELLRNAIVILLLALTGFPLVSTLIKNYGAYNYPPYTPVYLRYLAQHVKSDHWYTSDMPWATAWYGDRASLWLPDTVQSFDHIYDNLCPSDLLMITPVTLDLPATNLTSGEDKEWLPFVLGTNIPVDFPLMGRFQELKGAPDYILWGNRDQQ